MSLFTKVRDAVRSVAAVAAPLILPGPVGNIVSAAVSKPASQSAVPPQMALLPPSNMPSMPGGGTVQVANPVAGVIRGAGQLLGRYLTNARGIVSTATGKIVGVMRGQRMFRVREVQKLARQVGIDAAAVALGVSAVEVAQMIAANITQSASKSRRGRGITGKQISVTRRTLTKLNSMQKLVAASAVCRPRAARRASK